MVSEIPSKVKYSFGPKQQICYRKMENTAPQIKAGTSERERFVAFAFCWADDSPIMRDDESGLYDAEGFVELAEQRILAAKAAGLTADLTLVVLPGLEGLKKSLNENARSGLNATLSAALRVNSLGGDSAAEMEGKGVKAETATLSTDGPLSGEDPANRFFQTLRKDGYKVCLDDFGAGAASFQYLATLEVDVVKLDGSAIKNALVANQGRAFLTALVRMCQDIGVETVAEMIDDQEILDFVRSCGVDYVQGFFFGKPSKEITDSDHLHLGGK
ncbi:MAG: EAL domain-containing protein [Rhodospirillales bacterium]|nr:EAL domain-containing protein [Rhodospirillales bacterium]